MMPRNYRTHHKVFPRKSPEHMPGAAEQKLFGEEGLHIVVVIVDRSDNDRSRRAEDIGRLEDPPLFLFLFVHLDRFGQKEQQSRLVDPVDLISGAAGPFGDCRQSVGLVNEVSSLEIQEKLAERHPQPVFREINIAAYQPHRFFGDEAHAAAAEDVVFFILLQDLAQYAFALALDRRIVQHVRSEDVGKQISQQDAFGLLDQIDTFKTHINVVSLILSDLKIYLLRRLGASVAVPVRISEIFEVSFAISLLVISHS